VDGNYRGILLRDYLMFREVLREFLGLFLGWFLLDGVRAKKYLALTIW